MPGQQITYGGWIKRVSGTGNMDWGCAIVDANHNLAAWCGSGAVLPDGSGGTNWNFYSGSVTIPANGAYVEFYAEIHCCGDADASLTTGYFDSALLLVTNYYHSDHLSNRLVTDVNGNVIEQLGHYPFGESWYNASNEKLLFTTYERDAESGNDYAMARSYVNRLGRFSSLDPLGGSVADPQTLNHYTYTRNDSIDFADPSGKLMVINPCDPVTGINCSQPIGPPAVDCGFGFPDPRRCNPSLFDPISVKGDPTAPGGGDSGTRQPNVDVKKLDLCTRNLYGVMSLSLQLSQSSATTLPNGFFAGVNMNVLAPQQPLNGLFAVTNNPSSGTGFESISEAGHVRPSNPYVTETQPGLQQPWLGGTQIIELGNALGLISGTYTAAEEQQIDATPAQKPNPLMNNSNSPPGLALLNCLMKNGGFRY